MGADLYIKSITTPARKKWNPIFQAACNKRDSLPKDSAEVEVAQKEVEEAYDKMMDHKGYFRDSYNGTSIAWRLGISWWSDVTPMLDKKGYLKGAKLLSFRNRVATAELKLPTKEELLKNFCKVDAEGENSIEGWHKSFIEKKQRLLEFLDTAIKLKEGVYCSL